MVERVEKKPLNQTCGQFVFVLDKQEKEKFPGPVEYHGQLASYSEKKAD